MEAGKLRRHGQASLCVSLQLLNLQSSYNTTCVGYV